MIEPSMMIIKSDWGGKPTFKLIPINKECPYVEAIFDPESKILAVIGNTKKNLFHMMTKLDDNGDPVKRKTFGPGNNPYKEERKTVETFQEYYISDTEEVKTFIKLFAVNPEYLTNFTELLQVTQQ